MWSIPLYGPLAIQGYGVFLCCGILLALWCATRHDWCREVIGIDRFLDMVSYAGLVGIIGARFLHVVTEPHLYTSYFDTIALWYGGFSILGTVISLLIFIPWYAYKHAIPLLGMLDLCALYAPLIHCVARIGCWTAGCCGGIPSGLPWAICDETGMLVHPTQWYSSLVFLMGFILLRWIIFPRYNKPGVVLLSYVVLSSTERLLLDFWRNDRIFIPALPWMSVHQYIALLMLLGGILGYFYVRRISYESISSG